MLGLRNDELIGFSSPGVFLCYTGGCVVCTSVLCLCCRLGEWCSSMIASYDCSLELFLWFFFFSIPCFVYSLLVYLSICHSIQLPIYLPFSCIYLSSIYLFIYVSTYLLLFPLCPSICLSIEVLVCFSFFLSLV